MTEFEEKDGKLVEIKPPCEHEWSLWVPHGFNPGEVRDCTKCGERQYLVPYGVDDINEYIEVRLEEENKAANFDLFDAAFGLFVVMVMCYLIKWSFNL